MTGVGEQRVKPSQLVKLLKWAILHSFGCLRKLGLLNLLQDRFILIKEEKVEQHLFEHVGSHSAQALTPVESQPPPASLHK